MPDDSHRDIAKAIAFPAASGTYRRSHDGGLGRSDHVENIAVPLISSASCATGP